MDINIFDGPIKTSNAQRDHILARVGAAAARLEGASGTIDVRMIDLNGPKGGVDKRCSIVLTPPGLATIRVEEQASDYYAAIDAASATLKRVVAKALEKTKSNGPR